MSDQLFTRRPAAAEFAPFYAGYIDAVPDGPVLDVLATQGDEVQRAFGEPASDGWPDHRYAAGKWSVRELLGHIVDAERVFAFRAMAFARGDDAAYPGMDQDTYVSAGRFGERSLESLLQEARHLRAADLALFSSFDEAQLDAVGTASGSPMSARALLFAIAGHERHHLDVLAQHYRG